ncbi:MAG: DKNYY domain-containing protein [Candidatus Moraniibacteriota bacterium]|nr:MAG: DKNYY domain-containing protein [Candidatus Moranbacteria bacterium]
MVETIRERPDIGYDAWKESHPERMQLAGYYSRDSEGVYWYHTKIIGADPGTFDVYSDRYAHDMSNVYYAGNSDLYTIIGADTESFQAKCF